MRQTSPHTTELIQRLYEPLDLRERLTRSRDIQAILSEIGDSNEPAAIVHILPLILSRTDIALAAAAALHKLLPATAPADLAWLDCALRSNTTYSVPDFREWHDISARKLDELERFVGTASFSLASFHQRSFSSPTPEQLRRLKDLSAESDHLIDENTREGLLFSLRGFD